MILVPRNISDISSVPAVMSIKDKFDTCYEDHDGDDNDTSDTDIHNHIPKMKKTSIFEHYFAR